MSILSMCALATHLQEIAESGKLTTYDALGNHFGLPRIAFGRYLSELNQLCSDNGIPLLSSIVVNNKDKVGEGYWKSISELRQVSPQGHDRHHYWRREVEAVKWHAEMYEYQYDLKLEGKDFNEIMSLAFSKKCLVESMRPMVETLVQGMLKLGCSIEITKTIDGLEFKGTKDDKPAEVYYTDTGWCVDDEQIGDIIDHTNVEDILEHVSKILSR